ncbi:sensor histidine kinase [Streptomyces cadmiisoli]|uniref:sensor histidine kinase n=1 Tax=Streptomyces cadmiisoli TaxID=2184053 RepID=UPI003664F6E5
MPSPDQPPQEASAVLPNLAAVARRRPFAWAQALPHLVFLVAAVGTLVRLVELNSGLCWSVAPPTALLGLLYAVGAARWERLGVLAQAVWLGGLLTLWSWVAWVVPAPYAAGYAWLAIPLSVLALRMSGRRTRRAAVCAVTALLPAALVRVGGSADPDLLAPPLAALGATVVLHRTQQRMTRESARQQREAGRLAERARIARDLHDTLAQELAGSLMLLQAAERDWDRHPDAARRRLRTVVTALDAHLTETRTIIRDLTPPALERDGLEAVLRDLCSHTAQAVHAFGAPRITFRREHEPYPLPTDRALALLRVARSLLSNACEHARASHIQVVLTYGYGDDATVTVAVRDDGRGFNPAAGARPTASALPTSSAEANSGRGYGLAAAVDRLRPLGGTLTVASAPGRGTCAAASLPVDELTPAGRP